MLARLEFLVTATAPKFKGYQSKRFRRRALTSGQVAPEDSRPGIVIRLYSEEDFLSRPEFTDPDSLRTNLASVILQAAAWFGRSSGFSVFAKT
jgi:hypothetical protein